MIKATSRRQAKPPLRKQGAKLAVDCLLPVIGIGADAPVAKLVPHLVEQGRQGREVLRQKVSKLLPKAAGQSRVRS